MTYQLKIVFALLFIYLFIVLLKTNRAKKKKKDMQERPDEALNAWNIYYLFLYAKVLLKVKAYFI